MNRLDLVANLAALKDDSPNDSIEGSYAPDGSVFRQTDLDRDRENLAFFSPIHYTPSYRYPLVVYLHTAHSNARELSQVMPHLSLRNYVGAAICGNHCVDADENIYDWTFNTPSIHRATDAVNHTINAAMRRYSVHPERVVLVGIGDAGAMAIQIAVNLSDRISGVVSMGSWTQNLRLTQWKKTRSRPLRMLYAFGERNPSYTQANLVDAARTGRAFNAKMDIRQYPIDDERDTQVFQDVDRWIMNTIVDRGGCVVNHRQTVFANN